MINDAEKYREADEEMRSIIVAKNELESYVYQIKSMVSILLFFFFFPLFSNYSPQFL